jgi:hypothetical protein
MLKVLKRYCERKFEENLRHAFCCFIEYPPGSLGWISGEVSLALCKFYLALMEV